MAKWRLIEFPDEASIDTDLTDNELIGIQVILCNYMGEPHNDLNVYYRAWDKLRGPVEIAGSYERG